MKMKPEERFWSYVDKKDEKECWEWKGGKMANGYGNFNLHAKSISAHRMSWMLYNGEIPENLWVLHRCDNRGCVNPRHLFLGTRRDNIDDMIYKGRSLVHERNSQSKLQEKDIPEIRKSLLPQRTIAKIFGISQSVVWSIKAGKTWKGIE